MATSHTVSIEVQVTDPRALHEHVRLLATSGPGAMTSEQALDWLGSQETPDIGNCLRFAFHRSLPVAGVAVVDSCCD